MVASSRNPSHLVSPENILQLKEEVKQFAIEIGIDKIGFTTAEPFSHLFPILKSRQEVGFASSFEEKELRLRIDPKRILPTAQSIIAIALAYPSKIVDAPHGRKEGYRGMICRSAWGLDYHQVLREKLSQLAQFLQSNVPTVETEGMVDTGALVDRAVAERAGLGWIGKNCSLITPEFGSWVYLGELITSLPFPPDEPLNDGCGPCTRCLDACPTQAFVAPYQLNANRCLSQVTQEKNWIAEEFRLKLGNRLYGCDTCQQVCPYNRKKDAHFHEEFEPDGDTVKPPLQPLLQMGKRDFAERYGTTAAAWRGKKPLQRNAIIALAHFRDRSARPLLEALLQHDPRPPIRGIAGWALHQIFGEAIHPVLEKALAYEQDERVRVELQACLEKEIEK